ncbi:MAG: hypothetical protein ACK5O2_09020 [Microthrixaceae bacterium]
MAEKRRSHRGEAPRVLRGGSPVPAPLILLGLVLVALALVNLAWTLSASNGRSAWVETAAFGTAGVAFLAAARGCRLVVRSGEVIDQVAFMTIYRVDQADVVTVRTRAGIWRTFEVETTDGRLRVLLGCGPLQFPANLVADAGEHDLARIDTITGSVRS